MLSAFKVLQAVTLRLAASATQTHHVLALKASPEISVGIRHLAYFTVQLALAMKLLKFAALESLLEELAQ